MVRAICKRVVRGTGPCPHPDTCTCFDWDIAQGKLRRRMAARGELKKPAASNARIRRNRVRIGLPECQEG